MTFSTKLGRNASPERRRRAPACAAWFLVAFCLVDGLPAAELSRADVRFAAPNSKDVPHLQRHVLPLLGQLGCNGRACHGSFQGQGGFRLSLFGYDFKIDHQALVAGEMPRVDLKAPRQSLILVKPTGTADEHGGGHRLDVDSWQYRLLERWIEAGAPPVDENNDTDFVRLEITPAELVFKSSGDNVRLRAVCHWSDGTAEDVTPLCRFQTGDESVAKVDPAGQVTAVGKGDTQVVVFYDNGVVPVATMLPVSDRTGPSFPPVAAPTKIDELVVSKLNKLGVVPSDVCTDAEFLRRASLDITGTLPLPDEIVNFLQDTSLDKRDRKIDELLARPAYSVWWAVRLSDWLGNGEGQFQANGLYKTSFSKQWYRWLERRLAENVPYVELAERMILSLGRSSPEQTFEQYCAEMSAYARADDGGRFVDRQTMPWYWARYRVRSPNEIAVSFSHAFLGVRLQCAECHKHPFDQWSQYDFQHFTAFFTRLSFGYVEEGADRKMLAALGVDVTSKEFGKQAARVQEEALAAGKAIPFPEVHILPPELTRRGTDREKPRPNAGRVIAPKVLGDDELVDRKDDDPRRPLMDWLRRKDNPYFARTIVNRVWANYFNVGIVEPPDDMNLANAPSNRELLDYLTTAFIEHGYDLKRLHREITRSRTYQRSWQTNPTNELDLRNFSHAVPRRLPAEVLVDAVQSAGASRDNLDARRRRPLDLCAIGSAASRTNNIFGVLNEFGKPKQLTPCDCERSSEPTLLQTIFLQSSFGRFGMKNEWLKSSGDALKAFPKLAVGKNREQQVKQIAERIKILESRAASEKDASVAKNLREQLKQTQQELTDAKAAVAKEQAARNNAVATTRDLIGEAYLRTFSRPPTDEELARVGRYIDDLNDAETGLNELMWALINSKEFLVNH